MSARKIDPVFTCGQADCAVRKALDLTCDTLPGSPHLFVTSNGPGLFSLTRGTGDTSTGAHLMTTTASGALVEDVSELNNPVVSWYSLREIVMSSSSSGKRWLFGGQPNSVVTVRETETGWVHSSFSIKQNSGPYLAARMVDDNLGYVAYGIDTDDYAPHLATWDGSCWTDQALATRGTPDSVVLAVDEKKQPWVAWLAWLDGSQSLYLRGPGGDTHNLLSEITADALAPTRVGAPLRLLPGGYAGTAAFPVVAAATSDGVRLFSRQATDPGWRSAGLPQLPETASNGTGCPSGTANPNEECRGDPCFGSTSCEAQITGVGSGFDLVRTQSGRTFAARVVYSSQGTYALQKTMYGFEFPMCYCSWTETSGTGTAELVLMHLTEGEPILSRFRFDMGGAAVDLTREVVLAARGDTLQVAAQLGGSRVPTLTYIEIDSSSLP